ncbi:ISL3 family transposase [Caldalkalibacillus thermarum TA2.A1]|uniref:ISL3 family transposase n=3 Tax=Caldalkalibacillus TaxID=379065 RepID=A0A8X8LC39_CALTT|nr:ISL3 family transposase [Caldalkalibacillus thermarum]QZT34570.1 ISL3 family transposase [Caldalkalibacillus thermarum TA2.A1]
MKDFQKELNVFQEALHIEQPWYVSSHLLDREHEILHIYLDFPRGSKFMCSHCGAHHQPVHDIVDENRTWRHLDFWEYKTYLHARLPRTKCKQCGKTRTVQVEWSRPNNHFTWKFESYVLSLMKEMPVAAVAREVREHDTRLWRIFHYYVHRAMQELDLSTVRRIAIDETSVRRGHDYITLFVDVDTKKVLFATEGKDSSVLSQFKQHLEDKGIPASQIEECCCDMSPAFINGIESTFPNAKITYDKFHVMKMVNEAVDTVRRAEQKEVDDLKKTRYIWLKNEQNLTAKQREQLIKLKDTNLKTARAYKIKLALQDFWTYPAILADIYFNEWYNWAIRSQLEPIKEVARSLKRHQEGILRWFQTKITNGLLEGINSLVQASKRKARGYRTTKNFISMVYATANKLDVVAQP